MTAKLMLGAEVTAGLRPQILRGIQAIQGGVQPGLAAVMVGANEASETYLRNKRRSCEELGFRFQLVRAPSGTTAEELIGLVGSLNQDSDLHGVFVQLPLPSALDVAKYSIFDAIDPLKDVDGLTSTNSLSFYRGGIGYFLPATVRGVMEMMLHYGVTTEGKRVLVTGRSDITGKAFAMVLGGRSGSRFGPGLGNAQVIWCNRHTPDHHLLDAAKQADVIVSCAGGDPERLGREYLIPGEAVKKGSAIFDVALRRNRKGKLVGDVETEAASERAAYITPVPGGVGPMTVTGLLQNVLDGARYACGLERMNYVHEKPSG